MSTWPVSQRAFARLVAAGLTAASVALAPACFSRDPAKLCEGATDCEKGAACIVGRCRPAAEPVVPVESRRIVLSPTDVAVLSSRASEPVALDAIPFGRASLGDVVLLLQFDAGVGGDVDVDAAFLTLEPPERAPAPASAIAISIATPDTGWRSDAVSWARQPPFGVPEKVSSEPARGKSPLRIDVTHLYRASHGLPNGLAVLAHGDDPIGAAYATGLGTGVAPKLELYVTERAGPSAAPLASASAKASASASASARSSAEPDDEEDGDRPPKSKKPPPKPHPRR